MNKIIIITLTFFFINNVNSNEPFVVLEHRSASTQGLNKTNLFVKNQNHSVNHKVKSGESLSGIIKKYYGNSGLNMKIVEVSLIEMNKHAFVRNNPHFLFAGKKLKIPSINEIMNLVKNVNNSQNVNSSSKRGHIYFYGN